MTQKTIAKIVPYIGILWALAGISLIFLAAIIRMMPYALESLRFSLSLAEWLILLAWCSFMLITEGYMGFQKQFAPRVADRARNLLDNPRRIDIVLAPLFCMGYFNAAKKRIMIIWSVTLGIVLLIVLVRHLPQPWRGIIDLGVIAGLAYGLVSIYYFFIRTLNSHTL